VSVTPIVCFESLGCDSVRPSVSSEMRAKKLTFLAGKREAGDAGVRSCADGSVVSSIRRFALYLAFARFSCRGQRSKFERDYKDVLRVVIRYRIYMVCIHNRPGVGFHGTRRSRRFMPHTYNRTAFQYGMASANALLILYCSLVDLELALKDHFSVVGWRNGHAIIDWVAELGEAALAAQLANGLGRLRCTARDGSLSQVLGNSYPDVRYLRHESDWPGFSTDAELRDVLGIVADIRTALRGRGVAV
jgi:hypothetical protein